MVSPPAPAPSGAATSWYNHPLEITQTRRFLAVSTRSEAFQYSRPGLNAYPLRSYVRLPLYRILF
jgi:hypothetical protein